MTRYRRSIVNLLRGSGSVSESFQLPWVPDLPDWLADEQWVPPGHRAVYAYARSGLRAVLREPEPGLALIPEFLPPGVVSCFRATGHSVEFYPVNADLSLPAERLDNRLRSARPSVVMFVHYFGFADESFPSLVETAHDVGTFVVEDAARGLFSRDDAGRLLGSVGDAAVFSLRKVLPIPHGGLVVASSPTLPEAGQPLTERLELLKRLVTPAESMLRWTKLRGSISEYDHLRHIDYDETELEDPPGLWPPASPGWLSRFDLARSSPRDIVNARRRRYGTLYDGLSGIDGVSVISPSPRPTAAPFGVVLSVPAGRAATDRLIEEIRRAGLPVDAFRWPTGVAPRNLSSYPDAETIRFSTFIVPTHPSLPMSGIDAIIDIIKSTG